MILGVTGISLATSGIGLGAKWIVRLFISSDSKAAMSASEGLPIYAVAAIPASGIITMIFALVLFWQ